MQILLFIYKYFIKIIYFFLKFIPSKENRVLMLSRQENKPSIDFQYIIDEIHKKYKEKEVVILTKRMEKTNFKQIISYMFHPFVQMYYLATSRICIIDGYQITVSCLKHKKDLKIIQIWHSLAAIKKFGYQTLYTKKDERIAKLMCMHKNYDAVVSGSKEMVKHFSKAFNYPEDKFITCGLPRVDYLLKTEKTNKNKVYKEYPELKKEKIVVYVPTFRVYDEYKFDELIEAFAKTNYKLIIKKHPRTKVEVDEKYTYDKCNSLEFLSVADYVITDYSAAAIEAAILNKPILLYVYDYEKYCEYEGVNTNLYEDLPGYVFEEAKDLVKCLKTTKYDKEVLTRYREKYITVCDGTSTEKLVKYIMEEL